jgi:hypothetical protein
MRGVIAMEKTLIVVKEMMQSGIIGPFAIGGGIAATYYIEPVLTYDLDIFFIPIEDGLDVLAPIYRYAGKRGFPLQAEAIMIEGFPVQFIPAYNELVREAVRNAVDLEYRSVKAPVVRAEYLAAIAVQTGRSKDRERVARLLEGEAVNRSVFGEILKKHGLSEKWRKIEGLSHEK